MDLILHVHPLCQEPIVIGCCPSADTLMPADAALASEEHRE